RKIKGWCFMNFSAIWDLFTKLIDICFVWIAFYYILKNVKNNIKMVLIVKGVIIILIVKVLSDILNLYTVGVILEYAIQWGPLAVIVIFQPEIRSVLESLGRTQLLGRHKILTVDEREKVVYELMRSVEYLRKNRIGALIVIEREISLEEYIRNSTKVYADISDSLLETIFFPNSPLHDGGVIIQGDRITCAGSVFKTSMNPNISKRLGTRHRAALGIAEESDAVALIVSEETGRLSIAVDSELHYNLEPDEFRMMLIDQLRPKMEVFFEAGEKESDGEENA
ncbi:MAG: diadenylate cyclase CdaA, partial [Bacilli bacterium]